MVNDQDAIVVLDEGVDESQENNAACCKGSIARAVV
jgi:putative radical SAM-modified peptide